MSRTYKDSPHGKEARYRAGKGKQRHISVRSVRRDSPDLRRLTRAVIAMAMAEAEAEAEAAREQEHATTPEHPNPGETADGD